MNTTSIETQRELASQRLGEVMDKDGQTARAVTIIFEFLSSLLEPSKFTGDQREDLRKLALELGFQEDSSFQEWENDFIKT